MQVQVLSLAVKKIAEKGSNMLKSSFLSNEYLVSDEGYVLSKRDKTPLKYSVNHQGYAIVNLMIDGKRKGVAVHTLVARAFCEGYEDGLTVNHKDGNKLNNNSNNLEWITSYENTQHARNVLGKDNKGVKSSTHKEVTAYDKNTNIFIQKFNCLIDGAKFLEPQISEYNKLRYIVSRISRCANGHAKQYRGYIWKYD